MILTINKKYYLITYYNTYYEVNFIGVKPFKNDPYVTDYMFRTKKGDLFIRSESYYPEKDNNFISECFVDTKIELAKRIYAGCDCKRMPLDKKKLLGWVIKHYPEKLM